MFDILSPKGNVNQNNTKIPSHHNQNGNHQENKQQTLVRIQGIYIPTLFLGNVNWYIHYGNQ
jgi:hypothetical protein